jgi:AcrR family transcriptional regulator
LHTRATAVPSRPTRLRGDTRARLLEAALAVYEAEGHAGFNVHAIVARSGVSLGSLYHHFRSMDGLCAALYARSLAALLDRVSAALARARSLRGGVAALVRSYLAFAREERTAMLFIHASSYASFLPAHEALIADSKAPRMEAMRAFFDRHATAGELLPLSPELLEVLLIGPVAELTRRWLAGDTRIDLEQAARTLPPRLYASITR